MVKANIEVASSFVSEDVVVSDGPKIYNEKPDMSWPSIKRYAATRIPTLFDIPIMKEERRWWEVLNPIPGLSEMTALDWNFYGLGFFAWTVDSMDFFCVGSAASDIANTLNVTTTEVTWGITLVLMLRSVGAFIFGLISDNYGRKWPYIVICFCFIAVELGTGFAQTYAQFLGVRALFGVLMGAMYPVASLTALEDQPSGAKSILSGLFLPGYNFGYLLIVAFYRAFEFTNYKNKHMEGWRNMIFFTACLPLILIVWRLCFPESPTFIKLKESKRILAAKRKNGEDKTKKPSIMDKLKVDNSLWITLKTEWLMIIYLLFLMSGFNFISHGSQDLYPTLLVKQHHVTPDQRTYILVIVNFGAMLGGVFFGQLTELLGRRLTICICMLWSGAFLYPSFFSNNISGIIGGYFFLNFGVMGAWGVAPLHLIELVNTTHRALLSGLMYQLGNLASSASSTIEAELGLRFPLPELGEGTYNYGLVMCIFCAAVFAFMLIMMIIGPERFHKDLKIHLDEESVHMVETNNVENDDYAAEKGDYTHAEKV
jgi:SHS family lactate transporter-like MFS transporter